MKKVELLSPVGNMETLYFAIHNGCDAVYFAGKKFGARKFANNFSEEEIVDAIKYCHLYGVKAYITVNTLMFDNELEEVLEYIDFLYKANVDALIMQDIGLIKKTHELYPNLEIHISTQSHNHNDHGIDFFEKLGATRIVLDREMSLDEINRLNTKLEKEVFIHGALCVSYSGCCLFSSMNGGRSGNRGECVASCRLKYDLFKNDQQIKTDGKYLLSTKELNTLNHIKELIESGISSFKIEGRMKSPEYVGFVTRLYRKAIDKYYNNEDMTISEEDIYNLKKLYNREFTEGYLFNKSGKELMNIKTPNHLGVEIGRVIEYDRKYIKILLTDDVNQEDGIRLPNNEGMILNRIYNNKLLLVNKIEKGNILVIDNKVNLKEKGKVLKTIDKKLMEELKKYTEKKIPIDIEIICKINNPIKMIINDETNTISKEYSKVEKADNYPIEKDRIIKQITKLGNTPFSVNNIKLDIDENIFISIKDLNELRRSIIDELIELRQNKKKNYQKVNYQEIVKNKKNNKININVLIRTKEQLEACISNNIDIIYTEDKLLYEEYKDKCNIYLKLPRVLLKHPNYKDERLLITEIGSLNAFKENNNLIADYTLNITNKESIKLLEKNNVNLVTISPEITIERLKNIDKFDSDIQYIIYGTIELMIMKYCPLKMLENNDNNNCNLCSRNNKYYLKDQNNFKYPVLNTKHYTHIMHKEPINNIKDIKLCLEKGINNFRVDLLYETKQEIENIIKEIKKELGD
ncbi:MAG: U32 family peptidase [Firmicutes bacterium]|nr:U32 family peptidase [Bacillota bacterium]